MHVVATAGHVDHGKSTLVRLLTGMEPDRWAEERRRGMTIDLGYAWTDLPSGERVAFVDVPGHERFITNMLAGVGPAPAVMLVVAADEGWRPQTEEHVAALAAFGVEHLLLVVTRSDLADPTGACAEALEHLARHDLTPTDVVTVSGVTGAGKDELVAALDRLVSALPPPSVADPARLWVDRVFRIRGAGVVVTGTLQSGRIDVGDRLEVPGGGTYVVRGLESCKEVRDKVTATARVAVNVRGADTDSLHRGDCLVPPDSWVGATDIDAALSTPIKAGEWTLHVGSAAASVRVRPLGPQPATFARVTLSQRSALRIGDRGLLRRAGSHDPAVGVRVLDINPLPLLRRGDAVRRAEELALSPTPTAADLVDWHGVLTRDTLRAMHLADPDGEAVTAGPWLISPRQWNSWRSALKQELGSEEDARGRSRGDLIQAVGLPDDAMLDALLAEIDAELVRGWIRRPDAGPQWSPQVDAALAEVEARLRKDPFRAPELGELDALGLDRRVRGKVVEAGHLVAISRDVYLLPEATDQAVELLAGLPEAFTVSEARQALNSMRRVVVPLLEYLDGAGYTRRVDATHRRLVRH